MQKNESKTRYFWKKAFIKAASFSLVQLLSTRASSRTLEYMAARSQCVSKTWGDHRILAFDDGLNLLSASVKAWIVNLKCNTWD